MKSCCEDTVTYSAKAGGGTRNIALIGNPNAGKTTLFNRLTGTRQRTGNWPGVTVERKEGEFEYRGAKYRVVDLPGVYMLEGGETSVDEQIARNFLRDHPDHLYINIVDASTLERGLFLTAEICEQGVQVILLLNMMDVAAKRGRKIDTARLSRELGCPVVAMSLGKERRIDGLLEQLASFDQGPRQPLLIRYPEQVEQAIRSLQQSARLSRHAALQRLQWEEGEAARLRRQVEQECGEELDFLLADTRFAYAERLTKEVVQEGNRASRTLSDRVDRWVLGSWTGIPIFLALIYLLFLFSINLGGAFIDLFDQTAQALLVDGPGQLLRSLAVPEWLVTLLAEGVGGGIQVVATFIPIIAALYLFLTLLEESGYMARAAFVMNRFMRRLGVSGKAFVPLIIGFGCNVPAIMATRTLDSHQERILTILMAPFMSCGARLTVYALFATVFFPSGGQNIIFLLYLIGIGFAILTGLVLRNTLLRGSADQFIMELPTYQIPSLQNILLNTWNKLSGFITGAGKIIVIVVTLLTLINSMGTDGSFGNQNSEKSLLSAAARGVTPLFQPMGISEQNWPATVGIITGLLAKEVVVGTLDALYSGMDRPEPDDSAEPEPFHLGERLRDALATVPDNLRTALRQITDPLGIGGITGQTGLEQVAQAHGVDRRALGAMLERFDGKVGAFAYMLFILLYFPCAAATGAMYREAGPRWTMLGVSWNTGLAYAAAVIFYQMANLPLHPMQSLLWSGTMLAAVATAILIIQRNGGGAPSLRRRNAG
ncbi:MAG TPA: Fe(2+) transporter permease subunit FeoB [Gammaproteobacteria bacterium]|nr:Fe(2+) transporter permease subunit FeoB [Gammaproteobacteria bacterium]